MANLKDFATGTVLTAPSPATSGTTMLLQNNEHLLMPPVPFYATAHPDNVLPTIANSEKILVTNINTSTQVITFARAQGDATAKSIAAGWRISNTIFAADLYNGSIVKNEVPSGLINGSNTAYTIAAAFTPGSLEVYLNGQRLKSGSGNDYVENSSLTGFTMQYAPDTGDVLVVDYVIGSSVMMNGTNVRINQETPTGSVNGSNTAFTTARAYISGSLEVYVNGLLQAPTTHVTEVSPSAGTFSLDVAPQTGDIVRVSYQYAVSTGGNAASVNGIAASTTATANQLMPLNASAKYSPTLIDNAYRFRVYRNAAWSPISGSLNLIPFDAENFDPDNRFELSPNHRYTALVAGTYFFFGRTSINANTRAFLDLYVNGVMIARGTDVNASAPVGCFIAVEVPLNAGDLVTLHVFTTAAGGAEVDSTRTYFGGRLVGS